MAAASGNKRRWVLHFDINNTILMSDPSKGLNTVDNVRHSPFHGVVLNKIDLIGGSHRMQECLG